MLQQQDSCKHTYSSWSCHGWPGLPDDYPLPLGLRVQEHVQNCRASAQHAVASIMDPSTGDYDYLPYFYSRIFNLSWQVRQPVTWASERETPVH